MTTPTRDEAVRQQFEAWAVEHGLPIERDSAGSYTDDEAQTAWSAVQYVDALRSPAVAGLVEALKDAECELACQPRINSYVIDKARAALAQYATLAGEKA